MIEKRYRICISLPKPKNKHQAKVHRNLAKDLVYFAGGVSVGDNRTNLYVGFWDPGNSEPVVKDKIFFVISDVGKQKKKQLSKYLSKIKSNLEELLQEDEVWIVFHKVFRVQ